MTENPYEPPQLPAVPNYSDRVPASGAKRFLTTATALVVFVSAFQSLAHAIGWLTRRLAAPSALYWLAVLPALMLAFWLARLTWRSERWDWWASVQIGAALTIWTVVASLSL